MGAILTGVFYAPSLGGMGPESFDMAAQVGVQLLGVAITVVWAGVVSIVAFKIVDLLIGLRVSEEDERMGLDVSAHGEKAYND